MVAKSDITTLASSFRQPSAAITFSFLWSKITSGNLNKCMKTPAICASFSGGAGFSLGGAGIGAGFSKGGRDKVRREVGRERGATIRTVFRMR